LPYEEKKKTRRLWGQQQETTDSAILWPWSKGHWFDSRPACYQVNYVNSAFHPSGVGKSSMAGVKAGARSLVSGGRQHCVIPYGKWRPVAVRWCTINSYRGPLTF